MDNVDKTTRSIFVGNIPYEATEEKLMTLFSQAGPVIGFRLVYDRESGKPKGYGFCEYNSAAVAASALRNLDNIDYNGRPLRIGPAAGEQNSAEVAMTNNTTMKPPQESPYGEKCESHQAGVAISQAVASLPPEQLFDLMQQMKQCIESNPNEARQLLLQNPQLAYALLQAQIIMKIVEPKVAIAMLTRSNEQIPQAVIEPNPSVPVVPQMYLNPLQHQQPQQMAPPPGQQPPPQMQQYPPINIELLQHQHQQQQQQQGVNMYRQGVPMPPLQPPGVSMAPQMPQMPPPFNPFVGGGGPQMMPGGFAPPPQQQQQQQQQPPPQMFAPHQPMDIKLESSVHQPQQQQPQQDSVAAEMMNYLGRTGETEKAALIMQVLNLSDEEVAKLPDDQRRSIEVLKNQLKKN